MSIIIPAIAVVRVSSTKQGLQGDSPQDQLLQVQQREKQLSAILNCKIVIKKVFEITDTASGELDTQPILAAINYCKDSKNKIKYLFIKSIDRFTRGGSTTYGLLKAQLTRYGVQLIDCYGVISNQQVNTLSHLDIEYEWSKYSPSYITEILEAERGKGEVRDILTRMIGAEIRYVRLGYRVRQAPMGYQNEKIETEHGRRNILLPHPAESLWFIRMYELRAAGNRTDEQIITEINTMGFKSRDRKKHDTLDTKRIVGTVEGKSLNIKQLQQYIKNPIYSGINCEKWTNGKPIKERFKGLVSVDLWNRANRGKFTIIEADNKINIISGKVADYLKRKVRDNPLFPYRKYINCPICNNPFYGSTSRSGTGTQHSYYHCSRCHKQFSVKASTLLETVKEYVAKVEFTESTYQKLREKILMKWEDRQIKAGDDSISISQRITNLKQQRQIIIEKIKILSNLSVIREMETEVEKIDFEIAKSKQNSLKIEKEEISIQEIINSIRFFMERFDELLLGGSDPLKNAAMFSLLFMKNPTYEELSFGTATLAPLFKLKSQPKISKSVSVNVFEQIRTHFKESC